MDMVNDWHMDHSSRFHGLKSPWWTFNHRFKDKLANWFEAFSQDTHLFGPMKQYPSIRVWSYLDRLLIHLIHRTIQPTFKHVIHKYCYHLKGPSIIRPLSVNITNRLDQYHYFYRLDIKSYYASIDHTLLTAQIRSNYDDPRMVDYLCSIITAGVDIDGAVHLPKKGIPLGSSLSPFFGALYLRDLDHAMNRPNVFYARYMDDVLILFKSKCSYCRARKAIARILKSLKLTLSARKTTHGSLHKKGFHFLGIDYRLTRIKRSIQTQVKLNARTLRRAHDKALAHQHADAPATTQRYLRHWATWWSCSHELNKVNHLNSWAQRYPDLGWLAKGVLLGRERLKTRTRILAFLSRTLQH